MRTLPGDVTLRPQHLVDEYRRAYRHVHGREPRITHLTGEWYQANGETVHRMTLFAEISRLRGLAQEQRLAHADKSVVQRIIARLRNL